MRLAERMAMHAAAWQTTPPGEWQPGTRAGAWDGGAMDAPQAPVPVSATTEPVMAAPQVRGEWSRGVATEMPQVRGEWTRGGAVEAATSQVRSDAVAVPGWSRGAIDGPSIDVSRVRGSAWSHGAYRLFVRGRPVRGSVVVRREPEIMPCFEPVRAPVAVSPEAVRMPAEVAVRAPVPGGVVRAPVVLSAEVMAPTRAPIVMRALPEVTGRAPTAVVEPSELGEAVDGIVRRVVEWPLGAGGRPAVLGGALTRLELPSGATWRALAPQLAGVPMPGEGGSPVVFLDVETTALDRGAGALAFMIGLAAFVGGALRVEQWILSQLSAEPVMLAEVLERVTALAGPGAVLASYNGASFDVPLLRMRLQRARQLARVGPRGCGLERPHVDLLHPARRMWQGRDRDCRLATLERTRLGVRRVHDLAGHEIPAVFWAWLRRPGDGEVRALMQRAADHNLADLVTLPALGAAIGRCLTAPDDLEAAVRSAQHLVTCGRRDQALALLADWHARPGPAPMRRRALLLAADLLRRDGVGGAPALWAEVCRISPGDPTAHEALAKHLEHRVGDLEQALAVARASAAPCPRRVARLQRKLGAEPVN